MKNDKSKTLIPCYCDINAYDMPQEFRHLQGQDMSKVGFIQNLVSGIGKIISKDNQAAIPAASTTIAFSSLQIEPMIRRASVFGGSLWLFLTAKAATAIWISSAYIKTKRKNLLKF